VDDLVDGPARPGQSRDGGPAFRQLRRYNNACTRLVHASAPPANGMIAAVTITIHAIELVIVCVLVLLWLLVVTWRRI
jgi:hypothetical protein